jgi:hypothetical protein
MLIFTAKLGRRDLNKTHFIIAKIKKVKLCITENKTRLVFGNISEKPLCLKKRGKCRFSGVPKFRVVACVAEGAADQAGGGDQAGQRPFSGRTFALKVKPNISVKTGTYFTCCLVEHAVFVAQSCLNVMPARIMPWRPGPVVSAPFGSVLVARSNPAKRTYFKFLVKDWKTF